MSSLLPDLVKIQVLSSGTGPFQLGAAATGFRGIEALVDGGGYSYSVQSGAQFELGTCVWNATSGLLIRTPLISSNGNAAVAFGANVEVKFVALGQDLTPPGALPIVQTTGTGLDVAMSQNAVTLELDALVAAIALKLDASVFQFSAVATENIAANAFVNIYNVSGATRIRNASALDPLKFANGFVPSAISTSASGLVQLSGLVAATVSTPASEVWLSDSTPGAFATSAPTASGSIIQSLGPAIPGLGVFFMLQGRVLL